MMKTKMMVIGMFCGRWVQYLYQLWPTPRPSVQQPILLKLPFSCSLQKLFSPSKNYSNHLRDVAGSKARLCKALTPLLQTCLHIEQEWNIKLHCTMVPLSTRSCLKSNKLRPILMVKFVVRFPKIFVSTCSDLSNQEKYCFFVIFKLRRGFKWSKWKFKMAFAMKGGVSRVLWKMIFLKTI